MRDEKEVSLLKHFRFDHLPERLQDISKPFCQLAMELAINLPQGEEKNFSLRKLLESKDCAVRSYLEAPNDND